MERKEWIDRIFRIVIVVPNLERALDNWMQLVEFDVNSIELKERNENDLCTYKGKVISCPVKCAAFDMGGIQMELVQPLSEEGPYAEFLKKSGSGIHHIGVYSSAADTWMEKYEAMNRSPVFETLCNGEEVRLFDFSAETGLQLAVYDHMEGPCTRLITERKAGG